MAEPRVVGLDLSLTATGVALPAGRTLTIGPKLKGCLRLAYIRNEVMEHCAPVEATEPEWHMDAPLVVVEGYSFSSRNSHAHALGELGGVIRLALHEHGVPYVDVPPSNLKKYACNRGNAKKEEILAAAIRRLGYEGSSHDEADALWLRHMGLDALGFAEIQMPEANREALKKVAWPSYNGAEK